MRHHQFFYAVLFVMAVMGAGRARAQVVVVANPSFENPPLADNTNTGSIPGWNIGGTYNPTTSHYPGTAGNGTPPGADGAQAAFLSGGIASLVQNLSGSNGTFGDADDPLVTSNTQYTLTLAVGARLDFPYSGYSFQLAAFDPGTNTYTPLGTQTNTVVPPAGAFIDTTLLVDTTSISPSLIGQNLAIRVFNTNASTSQTDIDNVRLTAAAIPEPSIAALLGVTAIVPLLRRRLRRRSAS